MNATASEESQSRKARHGTPSFIASIWNLAKKVAVSPEEGDSVTSIVRVQTESYPLGAAIIPQVHIAQ